MLLYYFKICYIVILYSPMTSEILKSKKRKEYLLSFSPKSLLLYFKGK